MKRTRSERIRLGSLLLAVVLIPALIVGRLVHLQIILNEPYSQIVKRQSSGQVEIPAERGVMYDRNGQLVAGNAVMSSLYAYPGNKSEVAEVAVYLERLFELKSGSARERYSLAVRKFRWIRRRFDESLAARLATDAPRGLYLRKTTRREYPFGSVGKQVVGYTDIDGQGQAGVELVFDSILAGCSGKADIRRDGLRNTYRVNETALLKPIPGRSVVLTLDWTLQEIVESELSSAIEKHGANSGMAAFVDCQSGDVLAIAHYDPDENRPDMPVKLRAVTDRFEPGSVFKAFTAAAILDAGLVQPSDSIYCEEGYWRLDRGRLRDDKKYGWLSFSDVMAFSSNIGLSKYAINLGGENLKEALARFGIGRKTGCGLPGETSGLIASVSAWSDYNVAALSIGHAVAVNALQLAMGFAAIANGGDLLRPHIVLGRVDDKGYVKDYRVREVLSEPLSAATATVLRELLRGVVERGTATKVQSSVVSIAGKTGTAQIPDPDGRGYSWRNYMASFAGFFPYEEPLIAGVVILEAPQPIHLGGYTAGPTFRRIAERYSIINPDLFTSSDRTLAECESPEHMTVEVPDFVGRDLSLAMATAELNDLTLRASGREGQVLWQYPPADRLVFAGSDVVVAVAGRSEGGLVMPDLKGLSIREASAFLSHAGIKYEINGRGRVIKQSPRSGKEVEPNAICRLQCRTI